jgi:hypothetical protein
MLVMITAAGAVLIVLAVLFVLVVVGIHAEDGHHHVLPGPPPSWLARVARRVTGLRVCKASPQDFPRQLTAGTSRAHGERR